MKKSFYFLAIVLIISFLEGCKKDPLDAILADQARMYGKIVEKVSKKPVKGARVYLRRCTCVIGGCNCKVIDSLTTDATGRYDFTFKHSAIIGNSLDIFVRVPEGFRQENSSIALAPNTHTIVNYDIEITPRAWLKIHVKNVNPFDQYDFVWIGGGWSGSSSDDKYYGKNTDLFIKKEVIGNDSCNITWSTTKNKIDYFKIKKVYCLAHDTLFSEVFY